MRSPHTSSLHVGASEGLQSLFSYSSDLKLPLLVSSWECSEIGMSLSIGWITFHLVALVCVFHLMSLACFLPRVFVLISWLDTSSSLGCYSLDTLGYVHWSSFYTVHLSRAQYLIICLILSSIFDSMLIFLLRKDERHIFTFTPFSRDLPRSPYHFFLSYGARVEGWIKDMWL